MVSKYPAITMQAYDADNQSWIDTPIEIYFEFQKDSLNIESDSIKVDNQQSLYRDFGKIQKKKILGFTI